MLWCSLEEFNPDGCETSIREDDDDVDALFFL